MDAWSTHPCNGIIVEDKRRSNKLRASMQAAIRHMGRLSDHYAGYTNQTPFIELQRDIEQLKKEEARLQ